ncbi:Hypothetical predicted protein [Cloeon dipterum]|uniref:C2H2-type domain-containing protein n=1 Tax=Cloeon dipterum TaxID=197152 RepID=A0A8S1BWM8_9INSE|nr:Hypothetical predicted protein [Cloeon dipterum]
MKVTKEALEASQKAMRRHSGATVPALDPACDDVIADVDTHSVTSVFFSDGMLGQALLSQDLNFSAPNDEKAKSTDADLSLSKANGPTLPPMSALSRGAVPDELDHLTAPPVQIDPTGLLDGLHVDDFTNGYKLSTSPGLLNGTISMAEVHPDRDQLIGGPPSAGDKVPEAMFETPSSPPLPAETDVAGSLLLSSSRGPLPTISSSQVSSLLSALNSDLSNPELELSPPRKMNESLEKVDLLITPERVSTLTQTDSLDGIDCLIPLSTPEDKSPAMMTMMFPRFIKPDPQPSPSLPVPPPAPPPQPPPQVVVKQEKPKRKTKPRAKKLIPLAPAPQPPPPAESGTTAERVFCFKCSSCPYLSMDKEGVDRHIKEEHAVNKSAHSGPAGGTGSHQQQQYLTEPVNQELRCPGCPNIFFSPDSLKVHLIHDHRVDEKDTPKIISCLRIVTSIPMQQRSSAERQRSVERQPEPPPPPPPVKVQQAPESVEYIPIVDVEETKKSSRVKKEAKNTEAYAAKNLEVYTDDAGKIKVRNLNGAPAVDPAAPETSSGSGGDACESSDLDAIEEDDEEEEEEEDEKKKKGRPKGSKSIGITEFKRQNPSLRLGEKELGYRCAVSGCATRMRSHDNIEYHRKCHMPQNSDESSDYACPECDQKFSQWRVLSMHLWRSHTIDMELYTCDKCDFKTNSHSMLINIHKRIHGEEKPFLCDACGKGFKTNKQLRNHRAIHTSGSRPRSVHGGVCDICGRKYADRRMLRMHKDTVHAKLRPYLCNYCGYSASSRSTLKMHMRQHTDHNSLRRHLMRHSGQTKYRCPHCDYACIQSSTYKVHLKTKHPGLDEGLLFSCSFCSFRTIKKENYDMHVVTHTNEPAATTVPEETPPPTPDRKRKLAPNPQSGLPEPHKAAPNGSAPPSSIAVTNKAKITKKTDQAKNTQLKSEPKKKAKAAVKRAAVPVESAATAASVKTTVTANGSAKPRPATKSQSATLQQVSSNNFLAALDTFTPVASQNCFGVEDRRYPLLSSQLRLTTADPITSTSPMITLLDGRQFLQVASAGEIIMPVILAPQALQLALCGSEPEQISNELLEGAAVATGTTIVMNGAELAEVKCKVADLSKGS